MRIKVFISIALYFLSATCLVLWISSLLTEGFDYVWPITNLGDYYILTDEKIPKKNVTSFVISDNRIILYYDSIGLANIYDANASFLYGIQVGILENGRGGIFLNQDNGQLYINGKGNTIYVFQEKEFVAYYEYTQNKELFTQLEDKMKFGWNSSYIYADQNYTFCNKTNKLVDSQGKALLELPAKSNMVEIYCFVFVASLLLAIKISSKA